MLAKCPYIIAVMIAIVVLLLLPAFGDGPNFKPDHIFRGSGLTGWHALGQADWKMENGEIVGTPKQAGGGWLVLEKSFEDVGFYANVRCTAGCKTGVLFRAEKTPDGGMQGVYVSLAEGDLASYAIKLNAEGQELQRDKLPASDPMSLYQGGLVSPLGNVALEALKNFRFRPPLPMPAGLDLAGLHQPTGAYRPGEWNQLNVILYGDALNPKLNGGTIGGTSELVGSIADERTGKYGPIALYVDGTAEVRFRDVSYKDLLAREVPAEHVSSNFRMQRLENYCFSWSAAVADINRDGIPDVIAGPYYYLGPDYTTAHEFYMPVGYNPTSEIPQPSMTSFAYDFTGDGWPDILVIGGTGGAGTATLYVNPKGESRHWDKYVVVKAAENEDRLLRDIDGDGKPELIHAGDDTLRYSKPDPANPTGTWITKTISEPGPWGATVAHGLGVGDINGDGLMDFVTAYGWWEQPPKGSKQELWTYHPQAFGHWGPSSGAPGGDEIGVYDVNGDGLNDVVTAVEGHNFGLAWYEQKRDASRKISFVEHTIMDNFLTKNAGDVTFTEPHTTAFADMDGDGIPDLITGKRSMAHLFNYFDADPLGVPVLYVYRTLRNPKAPGGAEFVPELVYNRSGVGGHMAVADLNGDGRPDIVVSGSDGTFIFFNNIKPRGKASAALVPASGQTRVAPFAGRWDLTMTAPEATYPSWMEVVDNGGSPQVRIQLRTGNAQPPLDAKMDGSHLIVTIPETEAGPHGTWDLTVTGSQLRGTQTVNENVAKVAGVRAPALKHAPPKAWADPVPLFNGKDLTGWEPVSHTPMSQQHPGSHWVAKDGEIVNEGRGANLRTNKTFDDFKLHVEFNLPQGENSGVYLRGRYETQIVDGALLRGPGGPLAPDAAGYRNPAPDMGSIYGFLRFPLKDPKPLGEWQTYDITMIGRWVTITLNGFTGIDNQEIPGITGGALDSDEGAPGPFYLQGDHVGGVRYRNITVSVPKR